MTTFIFIWLFLGFIAVAMAAGKKLNLVAWAVMGALLGPIAIVLVAFQAGPPESHWSAGERRDGGSSGCGGGCGGGGCGGGGGGCGGGGG